MNTPLWKRKLLNNPTSLGFQVAVFRGSFQNVTCGKIPLWETLSYWQFLRPFPGSSGCDPNLVFLTFSRGEKYEKWPPFGWSKSHLLERSSICWKSENSLWRSFVWFVFLGSQDSRLFKSRPGFQQSIWLNNQLRDSDEVGGWAYFMACMSHGKKNSYFPLYSLVNRDPYILVHYKPW